jgi:hypothetical protein
VGLAIEVELELVRVNNDEVLQDVVDVQVTGLTG